MARQIVFLCVLYFVRVHTRKVPVRLQYVCYLRTVRILVSNLCRNTYVKMKGLKKHPPPHPTTDRRPNLPEQRSLIVQSSSRRRSRRGECAMRSFQIKIQSSRSIIDLFWISADHRRRQHCYSNCINLQLQWTYLLTVAVEVGWVQV